MHRLPCTVQNHGDSKLSGLADRLATATASHGADLAREQRSEEHMQCLESEVTMAELEMKMVGHAGVVYEKLVAAAGGPEQWEQLGEAGKERIAQKEGLTIALLNRFLYGEQHPSMKQPLSTDDFLKMMRAAGISG
jgi:hypothetical protein